jgi:hypothetical protein
MIIRRPNLKTSVNAAPRNSRLIARRSIPRIRSKNRLGLLKKPYNLEISTMRISQLSTNFIIYIRAVAERSYLAGVAIFLTFLSFASAWLSAPAQRQLDGWFSCSLFTAFACFFVATFFAWNEEHTARQEASADMAIKTDRGIDESGVSQLSGRINGLQLDRLLEDSYWKYLYVLLTISNTGAPTAVKSWKVSFRLPTGQMHTVADEEFSRQPVGLNGAAGNLVLKHSVIPSGGKCTGWLLLRCPKNALDGLSGAIESCLSDFLIEFWDVNNQHHFIQ